MTTDHALPPQVPPAPEHEPVPPADPDRWLAERLTGDPELLGRLGLAGQDLADTRTAIADLLADDTDTGRADRAHVLDLALRIPGTVGRFVWHSDVFGDKEAEARVTAAIPGHGWGVLALCALVATVPEVQRFHRSRDISEEMSWEALADIGRQVRVHRDTFDEYGLHAHGWLLCIWSGALYKFGRLQFNLQWYQPQEPTPDHPVADPTPRWVLSTHIPETGPLTPEAVAASFRQGRQFFADHFPDYPTQEFFCGSWLLDPRMARLAPESNTARFQALWRLDGPGTDANGDAFFFLWRRRGEVDPASLPADSSLRRLVIGEVLAGRPWQVCRGLIPYGDAD